MDLDKAVALFAELKRKIKEERGYLSGNEYRTRVVLIDPVLRMYGWDVEDSSSVKLEYEAGGGRADYALINSDDKDAIVVVEAKRLGSDIGEREVMQVLNYANSRNINFMVITNGDNWEMYDVFRRAPLDDRRILNISISADKPAKSVMRALVLWRPNLSLDGGPVKSSKPPPRIPSEAPRDTSVTHAPSMGSTGRTSVSESENVQSLYGQRRRGETSSSGEKIQLNDARVRGTKPRLIDFGQGEIEVKLWRDVYFQSAEYLIREGRLSMEDCPVQTGLVDGQWEINSDPTHSSGASFATGEQLSNGSWIEVGNRSAQNLVSCSRRLLQRFGVDPASVTINFQ